MQAVNFFFVEIVAIHDLFRLTRLQCKPSIFVWLIALLPKIPPGKVWIEKAKQFVNGKQIKKKGISLL